MQLEVVPRYSNEEIAARTARANRLLASGELIPAQRPMPVLELVVDNSDNYSADEWYKRGNCKDMDPQTFEPVIDGTNAEQKRQAIARKLCKGCPVIYECLEDALSFPKDHDGIAGGLTRLERQRVRKQRLRRTG